MGVTLAQEKDVKLTHEQLATLKQKQGLAQAALADSAYYADISELANDSLARYLVSLGLTPGTQYDILPDGEVRLRDAKVSA